MSVFGLRLGRWAVDRGLDQGREGGGGKQLLCLCELGVRILCVDSRSRYLYIVLGIPAHLRCTQCSILLHLIDICFLPCICL